MSPVKPIDRWRRLGARKRSLLLEATVATVIASIATRLMPFRHAIRLGSSALLRPGQGTSADTLMQARWAVETAARWVPLRAVCLQQGLALQWMLRRRGIDARLDYGIRRGDDGELRAHAWVVHEDQIILGAEAAHLFQRVASFP